MGNDRRSSARILPRRHAGVKRPFGGSQRVPVRPILMTMSAGRLSLLAALLCAGGHVPALAQGSYGTGSNQYEQRYGPPVDVSLDDLVRTPEAYEDRAVRTKGRLELLMASTQRQFMLRGTFGETVVVTP